MTTSEFIMVIQTIVLAITSLIVYRYTKVTENIWKETKNQNEILAEQLKMMREKNLVEDKREKSILEPLLIYNGGGSSSTGIEIRLINKGSTIRDINIKNLAIEHSYSPKDILESDKEIRFHFARLPSDLPEQMQFLLEYKNKFGEKRQRELILLTRKHKIIESTPSS